MDVITAISLVTGILSIPASIYALIQIRRDGLKPIEDADLVQQKYLDVQKRLSKLPNRILLTFSKENANREGTLENLIFSFWKEFSNYNRDDIFRTNLNSFIYRPAGVLNSTRLRISFYKTQVWSKILFSVIIFVFPIGIVGNLLNLQFGAAEWPKWVSVTATIVMGIWLLVGVCACTYFLYRNHQIIREAIAALQVVKKYVGTLDRLEIIISEEFTQSKEKFDAYHGEFRRGVSSPGEANPLAPA
jgi:hypothetical protein